MIMEIQLKMTIKTYNGDIHEFTTNGEIKEIALLRKRLFKQIECAVTEHYTINQLHKLCDEFKVTTVSDLIHTFKSVKIRISADINGILHTSLSFNDLNIKRLIFINLQLSNKYVTSYVLTHTIFNSLFLLEDTISAFKDNKKLSYYYWNVATPIPGIDPNKIEHYPVNVFHQKVSDKINIILKEGYDVKTSQREDGGLCIHVDSKNFKQR